MFGFLMFMLITYGTYALIAGKLPEPSASKVSYAPRQTAQSNAIQDAIAANNRMIRGISQVEKEIEALEKSLARDLSAQKLSGRNGAGIWEDKKIQPSKYAFSYVSHYEIAEMTQKQQDAIYEIRRLTSNTPSVEVAVTTDKDSAPGKIYMHAKTLQSLTGRVFSVRGGNRNFSVSLRAKLH